MSDPPFPVPQGMQWDGVKKRFFKKPPEKAKIHEPSKGRTEMNDVDHRLSRSNQEGAPHHRPSRLLRSSIQAASPFSASHAAMQQRKRFMIASEFSSLKHVDTTSLVPWRLQGHCTTAAQCGPLWRDIKIRSLGSSGDHPSLLWFQARGFHLYYLDTSHASRMGGSSALSVEMPLKMTSMSLVNLEHLQHMDQIKSYADRCLEQSEGGSPQLSYDGQLYTSLPDFTGSIFLGKTAMGNIKQYGHIKILSFARLNKSDASPDPVVLAYATDRQLGLISTTNVSRLEQDHEELRAAYQDMESDIICLEFSRDGSSIFIGLRSGKIAVFDTEAFLTDTDTHRRHGPGGAHAAVQPVKGKTKVSRSSGLIIPASVSGAVTHLVSLSSEELVVAFSEGTVQLRTADRWHEPLHSFYGHVNSWSLDLPIAVDKDHRILALAGQDRKVRVWSLDEAFPLRESTESDEDCPFNLADNQKLCPARLDQITFSERVTGLAFCARRSVARANARSSDFDQTGTLPGLAVACNGTEIGFFE